MQPDPVDAAEAARRAVAEEWLERLGVMLGARSAGLNDADEARRAQVAAAIKAEQQAKLAAEERRLQFEADVAARHAAEAAASAEDAA